jgi:uncharacterized membrane protein
MPHWRDRPATMNTFYRILSSFPISCFSLTVATDIAFLRTSNLLWLHFSEWLLLAGLVAGILAAIFLVFAALFRGPRPSLPYMLFGLIALILAALNSFIHTADGWTAVMPFGLATSVATVAAMIAAACFGGWRNDHG